MPSVPDNSAQIAAQNAQQAALAKQQADEAAAKEAQRQATITQDRQAIDTQFGQFTPEYFNKVASDYTSYYNPQLEKQYSNAQRDLTLSLAGRGVLDSSIAARQLGDLTSTYTQQQAQISDQAASARTKAQGDMQQAKSDLYGLADTAADPTTVQQTALTRANAVSAPQVYSPLGNVFANALGFGINNAATSYTAQQLGYPNTGLSSLAGINPLTGMATRGVPRGHEAPTGSPTLHRADRAADGLCKFGNGHRHLG